MGSSKEVPGQRQSGPDVVVRRSTRRRSTVAAFWEDGKAVVAIPAHFSAGQEREWVSRMLAKLQAKDRSGKPGRMRRQSDADLMARAAQLSAQYLQGRAVPDTVRWVNNQNSRWGSATPAERSIRLSDKLIGMPDWVVDYVILHELSHLLVASHGPDFWALLQGYPYLERAKAFLDGVSYGSTRGLPSPVGDPKGAAGLAAGSGPAPDPAPGADVD